MTDVGQQNQAEQPQPQAPLPFTEEQVNERFKVFSQQYNILITLIKSLPIRNNLQGTVLLYFDNAYLWGKEAFAELANQAHINDEMQKAKQQQDNIVEKVYAPLSEPLDAA